MKQKIFWGLFLTASLLVTGVQARRVTVDVKFPGTLSKEISAENKYRITDLTIRGTLNGTDLRFLREMAGSDVQQNETPGRLTDVDMTDVSFDPSGLPYIDKEGLYVPTSAHAFPRFLFRNTRIENVVLPTRTDTIGVGALERSAVRRVVLPDGAYVSDYAFYHNERLEEVVFPDYVSSIGIHAFSECPRLRRLSMNDVGYITAYAFYGLTAVEEIEIKGSLGHIDGWYTVGNCPRLKRMDFRGLVNTMGGPTFFIDCPELTDVVFHDFVNTTYIGKAENCPKLGKYRALGLILNNVNPEFWDGKAWELQNNDPRLVEVAEKAYRFYERQRLRSSGDEAAGTNLNLDVFYWGAALASRAGDTDKALLYLDILSRNSYNIDAEDLRTGPIWESLRGNPQFEQILARLEGNTDYIAKLKNANPYKGAPRFTYDAPSDSDLVRVREYFNLDSIAGQGDEISRIKNVMYWLHDNVRHDGSSPYPSCGLNAIELYELCKREKRGINCRLLASVLNEMYLSIGIKSRFLTCQSKNYATDPDCHVINAVWSDSLRKWIWIDPSFAAYVTDENGLLLHPGEVRERLIDGRPIVLNPDANWNHENIQTKEDYIDRYMAKNLYLISTRVRGCFEPEGKNREGNTNITLAPDGFDYKYKEYQTSDPDYFWQAPQ